MTPRCRTCLSLLLQSGSPKQQGLTHHDAPSRPIQLQIRVPDHVVQCRPGVLNLSAPSIRRHRTCNSDCRQRESSLHAFSLTGNTHMRAPSSTILLRFIVQSINNNSFISAMLYPSVHLTEVFGVTVMGIGNCVQAGEPSMEDLACS